MLKGILSVVPIKLVASVVPVFPVSPQPLLLAEAHVKTPDPLFVKTEEAAPLAAGKTVVILLTFVMLPERLT
jgi:hypothetical protein